jgi:selenocysteine lyase/cysteine desulfurase
MDSLQQQLSNRTKLVGVTHASNTLGCFVDVPRVVEAARCCHSMPFITMLCSLG